MEKKLTQIVIILSAIVIIYASCKKTEIKADTKTVDYKALSSQIAKTLSESISGSYGSVDVSKGITWPFATSANGRGLSVNVTRAPLCGTSIDTTYSYDVNTPANHVPPVPDTVKHYYGKFHFAYKCGSGVVIGYKVNDSVAFTQTSFNFGSNNLLGQHYLVLATDQTYKKVSMDGTINTSAGLFQILAETGSYIQSNYILKGLRVDFSSGVADIIKGTATFHMIVSPQTSVAQTPNNTEYFGTIIYLGNHTAKLTVDTNHIYMVDLITGVATPA